jgi:hypothetical protein
VIVDLLPGNKPASCRVYERAWNLRARESSAWQAEPRTCRANAHRRGECHDNREQRANTHFAVVGVADYSGNGTDDILFRNNSTGDTWIEAVSNGAFSSWQHVGGSDPTYSVKM